VSKVFLSYSREDVSAAKQLAECINRAGHEVWWDHQIEGGSRFTAEIDRELKGADAVVVIWTKSSVESPWVQDEAAEGRDNGRLVPILLGADKPPLILPKAIRASTPFARPTPQPLTHMFAPSLAIELTLNITSSAAA